MSSSLEHVKGMMQEFTGPAPWRSYTQDRLGSSAVFHFASFPKRLLSNRMKSWRLSARVLQTPLASLGEHIEVTVLATHDDPSIASVSSSAIRRHLVALLDQVPHQVLQYVAERPKLLELYRDVEASTAARRQ